MSGKNTIFVPCRQQIPLPHLKTATMKQRLLKLLLIYLGFIVVFQLAKPIFMLCNGDIYSAFTYAEWWSVLLPGLRMDCSMAAYLTIIPGFMTVAGALTLRKWPETILTVWRYIASTLIVLTIMTDAVLYSYWHFKLDTTPIFYFLTSPSAAMASVDSWVIWISIASAAVLSYSLGRLFGLLWNVIKPAHPQHKRQRAIEATVCSLVTVMLFIPIRGGFTVSTMNPSAAYFSTRQELNHAAVNPMFSLLYSATHQNNFAKEFRFFSQEEKERILATRNAVTESSDSTRLHLLDVEHPDVYIIILESFSSHLMPLLDGQPVAVNLDWIARDGITFTNFYASSFRTDRALPAILSGYPAQPSTSIMKFVERTDNLPSIAGTLRDSLNYRTAYYYGGDIHFVNQKAYLVSSGFETIVSDKDFPLSRRLSKWGAHDEDVFARMWTDIETDTCATQPVIRVLQTSSSHEPFDVPYEAPQFTDQRAVAFAYTDKCLGDFMRKFKQSPKWENALVVIVPDHYGAYPRDITDPVQRHRIPLVLTGGAVASSAPMTLGIPAAQSDIAATLLGQLGISAKAFPLSHDFLDAAVPQYAFFSEPDFAGLVTSIDTVVVSTRKSDEILVGKANDNADFARAFLQNIYDDLSKR